MLERVDLEAMMLASSTMAAALEQDALDVALHLRAKQGGAEHALALPR